MKAHLCSEMIDNVFVRSQTTRQFKQPNNMLLKTEIQKKSIKLAVMQRGEIAFYTHHLTLLFYSVIFFSRQRQ